MRILAIPVKSLARAKSRLSSELTSLERGALTLAMLEDVLDVAMELPGWNVWVVSPDEVVLEIAGRRGAAPVPEEKPPLAAAVRQAELSAKEQEAHALAVLHGDLPLLTVEALTAALHTLGPVVIGASDEGTGTNLLLRRPPRAISARFGPDSLRKHRELADQKGLPASVIERPEIAFDVDAPGDILRLLRNGRRGRTRDVCLEMDLAERLKLHA